MSATIIRFSDYRTPVPRKATAEPKRGVRRRQPLPKDPAELTPLDILNRIAVKLGLPALGEDGQPIPWLPGR